MKLSMSRVLLPLGLFGAGLVVLSSDRNAGAPSGGRGRGRWRDPVAPDEIRRLAAPIERAADWPGLGDFLVAVAWHESRGNARAVNPEGGPNAARGLLQIRPRSSNNQGVVDDPSLLLQPAINVAIGADYAYRMVRRWYRDVDAALKPDWLAIRRGWACPALVADVDEIKSIPGCPPSADVRARFLRSLAAVGLPATFAEQPAEPRTWPGQQAVLGLALNIANEGDTT